MLAWFLQGIRTSIAKKSSIFCNEEGVRTPVPPLDTRMFLLSCSCHSVSLPRGAMGWSMVCDCAISWSYSLAFRPSAIRSTCSSCF